MTREEIIQEINQLPPDERKAIAETVLRGVQEEVAVDSERPASEVSREEKIAAFHRLRGMLQTEGPPPTDDELKDDYVNYLQEKYS
jgi:DNA-directed RNA polymerase specialized sigma24 family protein